MNVSRAIIDKLLCHADIEGLIRAGAPSDEYSAEAEGIFMALQELIPSNISTDAIISIISEIWKEGFELDSKELNQRLPDIKKLAEEIQIEIIKNAK